MDVVTNSFERHSSHLNGSTPSPNPILEDHNISKESFLYGTLLALILVVSNTFNIFTIAVFMKNRLLHTSNNFLVVSLAVSDILHVTFGCQIPLIMFITEWFQELQQSLVACRILGYATHVFYSASTNNLVLISFHRLVSIVFSQKKIIATMKSAKRAIAGLWAFTIVSCAPGLFQNIYVYNPVLKACTILSYEGSHATYSAYSLALNFLVPLVLMIFFYYHIYRMLLHHKQSTVSDTFLANGVIEKKSKRLIIAVIGMFSFTWLPFYLTLSISAFSELKVPSRIIIMIWPVKMSSSMSNPILYAVCNRLFFRCMLRLWKCQGELRSRNRQSPLSNPSDHPSYSPSSNGEEEVSTIGPLPEPNTGQCEHCIHCRDNLLLRRGYPSHYNCYSSDLEPVPESSVTTTRPSTCSHCTEFSASLSTCSSVPTIFQLPMRGMSGSLSSTRAFGPTPEGQCYTDSGRSSLASQQANTPGMLSSRSSYCSNWPNSNRTSFNSTFAQVGSTPRGSTGDLDFKRIPSFSSRQSIYSSMSVPRSARSSVMSSRISHYAPGSSFSARSSLTSQYTTGSASFSTRPNTPQNVFVNADVELVYMPPERESAISASTKKSSTTPSTRHSSDTTLTSEKMGCRQAPDQMDIFEDEEPVSGVSSRRSNKSVLSGLPSLPDMTRQRVSEFLLGDRGGIAPDEDLSESEVLQEDKSDRQRRKKKSRAVGNIPRPYSNSPYTASPTKYKQYRDCSPHQIRRSHSASPCVISPCASPICDRYEETPKTPDKPCHKIDTQPLLSSVGQAVNLVVRARRLRSRVEPSTKPTKPDTPVPPHPKVDANPKVPHVREPIRFVYETPYPCNYYTSYRRNQQPPTANTLRVPGRSPLLNVPQTIQEEDTTPEPICPSLEVLSTPRRKNASSWLNPPIIDVSQGDDDMRVECPGVLVEHHN